MQFPLKTRVILSVVVVGALCGFILLKNDAVKNASHRKERMHSELVAPSSPQASLSVRGNSLDANFEFRARMGALFQEKPSAKRSSALRVEVEAWMRSDPKACIEFLNGLGGEVSRAGFSRFAIEIWIDYDAATAVAYVTERIVSGKLPAQYFLRPVASYVAISAGLPGLKALIAQLPQSEEVYAAATDAFSFATARSGNFDAAIDFAYGVPFDGLKKGFLEMVGNEIGREFGAEWLSDQDVSRLPPEVLTGLISSLYLSNTEAVLAWMSKQPRNPALDASRYRIAQRASDHPRASLEAASRIEDFELRNAMVKQAFAILYATDPSGAEEWAVASDVSLELLTSTLVKEPVPSAETFARRMDALNSGDGGQSISRPQYVLFMQWSRIDSAGAKNWLGASNLSPEIRTSLLESIRVSSKKN